MHYYQFNVADYRKDTTYLTPLEHYIYRTLIDWYYLDEQPIPKETQLVLRRLGLGSDGLPLLQNVLSDFFIADEEGFKHERIEEELAKYRLKAETARVNGIKGGRPKKPKKTQPVKNSNPEKTGSKANHKPITNNHNTTHKPKLERPEDVEVQVWDDFLNHRKRLRADVTKTALNGIIREAKKAKLPLNDVLTEIVSRGWRGFKAEWLSEQKQTKNPFAGGI